MIKTTNEQNKSRCNSCSVFLASITVLPLKCIIHFFMDAKMYYSDQKMTEGIHTVS